MSSPQTVTVIIGTGGMGLAIARRVGSGSRLVLADSAPAELESAAKSLRQEGHLVDILQTDVSDIDSVRKLASFAAGLGPIQLIAHTAGLSPIQASIDRIYQVDLLGPAYVIDAFHQFASRGTSLVVIASLAGHLSKATLTPDLEKHLSHSPATDLLQHPALELPPEIKNGLLGGITAYGISKLGNMLRVKASAQAWGEKGARINSVSPGLILTSMAHQELGCPAGEFLKEKIPTGPVNRVGTASDIANAVAFLASPEASFVTGTDLLVDGGWGAAGVASLIVESLADGAGKSG
ncbi:hypothetical protein BJX61DRAFT_527912 [Aspergillus egyptiacus]|nr:hypothetical protein BJX61DRAFT_527912 [Aspergillus egyptiacus]